MLKKIIILAVLTLLTVSLIGCQTVAGLGGDIKWTAETTASLLEGE